MTNNKKIEIVFAPGCFDNFDGTQDELDALIKDIKENLESGELLGNSRPISEEEFLELNEDIKNQIENGYLEINNNNQKRKLH